MVAEKIQQLYGFKGIFGHFRPFPWQQGYD